MVGTDMITTAINSISQCLNIPVLIILLVIVVVSLILLGEVIAEFLSRRKFGGVSVSELIYGINAVSSCDEVKDIVLSSYLDDSQKSVLVSIADSSSLKKDSREALARSLVEDEEARVDKKLSRSDIITRIGPTLGLMGTLIPMGPGLAALGAGDINTLASSLTIAFNTTIVGIGSGALCYVLGKIRSQWYDKYLSQLDALSDAILDFMD